MSHVNGRKDKGLHNEDGSHRATSASTRGERIELHERQLKRHMGQHIAELEKAAGEMAWICGGCLEATTETHYREGADGVAFHPGAGAPNSDETTALQDFAARGSSLTE